MNLAASWIVLLEAVGDCAGAPMDSEMLRRAMEAMACDEIVGLLDPYRCAIQIRVSASSPGEAVVTATARWDEAVRQLHLARWTLERIELVTPQEFERDRILAEQHRCRTTPDDARESAALLRDVFYDSLTGLPTLALFRDQAQGIISSLTGPDRRLALLIVDIDGLGLINRNLGYVYGDQVLAGVAGRLAMAIGSPRVVARLAGDEFLLLVDDTGGSAEATADQLLKAVRAPITVKGHRILLSASAGLARVSFDSDLDECLDRAGTAMCMAKRAGGDCLQWWQPGFSGDQARLDFLGDGPPDRLAHVLLLVRAALAANECVSLPEAAAIVMHQLLANTGWHAGHLWSADETRRRLEPTGIWEMTGLDSLPRFRQQTEQWVFGAGEGLPGRVLQTRRPEWTALGDSESASGHEAAAADAGFSAAVAFPVLAGAEVVAVLEFFSTRIIAPDESFLHVMAAVGAQLGRLYERTRAADALARSEARYRILADSLPELIWSAGVDGACEWVNRRWVEFTGRPLADEAGDRWVDGIHPEDRDRCLRSFSEAIARCQPFELEYRLRRADGNYRWLLDRGNPVLEGGVVTGYVGSCVDVTDRRRAENELRNEEARFRALVQNTDVVITVVSVDGVVLDQYVPVSSGGFQPAARDQPSANLIHPDDLERAAREFRHTLTHPGPGRPYECRVRYEDGSWRWMRIAANNMLDHPLVRGIVFTASDISEQVALAQRLRLVEQGLAW